LSPRPLYLLLVLCGHETSFVIWSKECRLMTFLDVMRRGICGPKERKIRKATASYRMRTQQVVIHTFH
jgi:hypothetical protein